MKLVVGLAQHRGNALVVDGPAKGAEADRPCYEGADRQCECGTGQRRDDVVAQAPWRHHLADQEAVDTAAEDGEERGNGEPPPAAVDTPAPMAKAAAQTPNTITATATTTKRGSMVLVRLASAASAGRVSTSTRYRPIGTDQRCRPGCGESTGARDDVDVPFVPVTGSWVGLGGGTAASESVGRGRRSLRLSADGRSRCRRCAPTRKTPTLV